MAYCVVLITAPDEEEADRLASLLVGGRLAACVNQVPGLKSTYRWKGEVRTAREVLLVAKTLKTRVKDLIRSVKKNHSYGVPEVLALPVKQGSRDYLEWITESLKLPSAGTPPADQPKRRS